MKKTLSRMPSGSLLLVFGFQTSDNLAAAYGVAVAGTMACTTVLRYLVSVRIWNRPVVRALLPAIAFGTGDALFFGPNLMKVPDGGWLVAAILRMGDQGEAPTVLPELKKAVARLRAKWQGVPITVRMDSAFGSPELYRWCHKQHVDYEIGLRPTSVLDLYGRPFMNQADEEFCKEFGEPEFVKADNTKDGEKAQEEHGRVRRLPTAERMEAEEDCNC